jgi:hypothetical protein
MMDRRRFLAATAAVLPLAALMPSTALADDIPPAVRRSDPGVPHQMDLRVELHSRYMDVDVYRYDRKFNGCAVAYDLDADTVAVIKRDQNGDFTGYTGYETFAGGVAVKWRRP